MSTYAELQKQIAALQAQAHEARKTEIAGVVADIRAKMTEYNLTVEDLGLGARRAGSRAGSTVAPKYRDPATGQTWSGRGKRPKWLAAEVAAGKSLEQFLIG